MFSFINVYSQKPHMVIVDSFYNKNKAKKRIFYPLISFEIIDKIRGIYNRDVMILPGLLKKIQEKKYFKY